MRYTHLAIKSQDMCLTFDSPTQPPWAASFGYRKAVSPEPPFVYRDLVKPPIQPLAQQLLQPLRGLQRALLVAERGQTEEAVAVLAEACTRGADYVGVLEQVI